MRIGGRSAGPALFALANAAAFCALRPGVPDLWAARARASAAAHGVGLTYWFGWFGGSTPGDYSVITPALCGIVGTATVAAAAALAVTVLSTLLVRGTSRPGAAAWLAAVGAVINLWCGRVPFLLGAALAVGALLFLVRRRAVLAVLLAVLSVLASPVSGVFLGLGLSGALVARQTRDRRTAVLITLAAVGATLLTILALFGLPGPEPFSPLLGAEILLVTLIMLFVAPSGHLRITLVVCGAVALVLLIVPNGMGANLSRLALFGLPPAAVALTRRQPRTILALVLPVLVLGAMSSVSAVRSAAQPSSSPQYYTTLSAELDSLPARARYRLELVGSAHAAYAVLLDHAILARGWETQLDRSLDGVLYTPTLDSRSYRRWLDDNAVGWVALDRGAGQSPETRVIRRIHPDYLRLVWSTPHWNLYEVLRPTPIVAAPALLDSATQASMTVGVPCACRTAVRVRWSPYLQVRPLLDPGTPDSVEDAVVPRLSRTPDGWTILITNRAGAYVLS